eukprot:COSAG02_NODE_4413_length_5385_cov_3.361899_4_plen_144_part_00
MRAMHSLVPLPLSRFAWVCTVTSMLPLTNFLCMIVVNRQLGHSAVASRRRFVGGRRCLRECWGACAWLPPLLTPLLTRCADLSAPTCLCLSADMPIACYRCLPALVGTPALTGTTHALIGPPAVVKTRPRAYRAPTPTWLIPG